MNTGAITNIDVTVKILKSELPQGTFLRSLTQPKITIEVPFKITDIANYQLKNEISRM